MWHRDTWTPHSVKRDREESIKNVSNFQSHVDFWLSRLWASSGGMFLYSLIVDLCLGRNVPTYFAETLGDNA